MFEMIGSLINGIFNRSAASQAQQTAINAQAQAQLNAPIETAVGATEAEKRTGINRLALLGVNPGSGPNISPPPDAGINGQGIDRALTAYMDKNDKAAKLNEELVQAKINNVNAETAGQQLTNSRLSRTFASPGSPPGLAKRVRPDGSEANPYPAYAYYDMGGGRKIRLLSHEAASTQFGPTSIVTGAELMPALVAHQVGDTASAVNEAVRPDVARNLNSAIIGNPAGDLGF